MKKPHQLEDGFLGGKERKRENICETKLDGVVSLEANPHPLTYNTRIHNVFMVITF